MGRGNVPGAPSSRLSSSCFRYSRLSVEDRVVSRADYLTTGQVSPQLDGRAQGQIRKRTSIKCSLDVASSTKILAGRKQKIAHKWNCSCGGKAATRTLGRKSRCEGLASLSGSAVNQTAVGRGCPCSLNQNVTVGRARILVE